MKVLRQQRGAILVGLCCLAGAASAGGCSDVGHSFIVEFERSAVNERPSGDGRWGIVRSLLGGGVQPCASSSLRRDFDSELLDGLSFDLTDCDCEGDPDAQRASIRTKMLASAAIRNVWLNGKVKRQPALQSHDLDGSHDLVGSPAASAPTKRGQAGAQADAFYTHRQTGVDRLHAANITGAGVRIGLIDEGFDLTTPGLSKTKVTWTLNLADGGAEFGDDCVFHGTHTLGILGAAGDASLGITGVAPDASYELVRYLGCKPDGEAYIDAVIHGTIVLAERKVDVISVSTSYYLAFADADPFAIVTNRASAQGIFITYSIGNRGFGPFTGTNPGMGADVAGVGSAMPSEAALYTWQGNYSHDGRTSTFRYVPGYPGAWPSHALDVWFPGELAEGASGCHPLPKKATIPSDFNRTLLLLREGDCWLDPVSNQSIVRALKIPYVLFYKRGRQSFQEGITVELPLGPAYLSAAAELTHDDAVVLISEINEGGELKMSFAGNRAIAGDVASAQARVTYRQNNGTSGLVSPFSTWGPTLDAVTRPTFIAPGAAILSTLPRRYGSYGIISGTSMSCPFAAGVGALVKQKYPDLTAAEIRALMATTARPVVHNDGAPDNAIEPKIFPFLAPVLAQGGGLLDAFAAVHTTTRLNVSSLSFNDTVNRASFLTFSVHNVGKEEMAYDLSHLPAASGHILAKAGESNFTTGEGIPIYAVVDITPQTLRLGPGQRTGVSVSIRSDPSLPEADTRGSYFGGFIAINASSSSGPQPRLTLPYTGFGSPLKAIPVIDRKKTGTVSVHGDVTRLLAPLETYTATYNASNKTSPVRFRDDVQPGINVFFTVGGSRNFSYSLLDRAGVAVLPRDFQGGAGVMSMDRFSHGGVWAWNGRNGNGRFLPEGSYFWQVRALGLFGRADRSEDYDVWNSTTWTLRYDANSTGLPPP